MINTVWINLNNNFNQKILLLTLDKIKEFSLGDKILDEAQTFARTNGNFVIIFKKKKNEKFYFYYKRKNCGFIPINLSKIPSECLVCDGYLSKHISQDNENRSNSNIKTRICKQCEIIYHEKNNNAVFINTNISNL